MSLVPISYQNRVHLLHMRSLQGYDLKEDSCENFHLGANAAKVSKTSILKLQIHNPCGFHGTLT